jgi:hypothetical protein
MEINKRTVVIVSLLLVSLGAGIGKYASPEKVVTKTETITVEKEVIKYKESGSENTKVDKVTVIVEDISKDGTIHRETVQVDKTQIDKFISKELDKKKETDTTVVTETEKTNQALWHISALASVKQGEIPSYGALVEKRVLGPISVGAFGLTNKTAGITIGYSF